MGVIGRFMLAIPQKASPCKNTRWKGSKSRLQIQSFSSRIQDPDFRFHIPNLQGFYSVKPCEPCGSSLCLCGNAPPGLLRQPGSSQWQAHHTAVLGKHNIKSRSEKRGTLQIWSKGVFRVKREVKLVFCETERLIPGNPFL